MREDNTVPVSLARKQYEKAASIASRLDGVLDAAAVPARGTSA